MNHTHLRRLAFSAASIGGLAIPALAQPARQIPIVQTPQPSAPAQQAPPAAQPGQVPVSIGGQTINVSPSDAANIAAWQERLRQIAAFKGLSGTQRIDSSMGETSTRDYLVPVSGGKTQAILTIPSDVQIGAWFGGSTPAASPSTDKPTPLQQLAGASVPANSSIPEIQRAAMTPEAVAEARAKYPASQGWNEVWLGDGGKVFAKGDPCDMQAVVMALHKADSGTTDTPRQQTVNDAARSYQAWYDSYYHCNKLVSDPQYRHAKVPTQDPPPPAKYSIAPESITEQTQSIRDAMNVITDDGRLERALAVSEMNQTATWRQGVNRLASVYLQHPTLASVSLGKDFGDLNADALRKMLTRVVSEANRAPDTKLWTAVAALMTAQGRSEQALNMLSRARKLSPDEATTSSIDGLFSAVNALPRTSASR